jgi:hypothetical protein
MDEWHLCAMTPEDKDVWKCAMNTAIGEPCCDGEEGEENEECEDDGEEEARFS